MAETFQIAPIPAVAHYFFAGLLAIFGVVFALFAAFYWRALSTEVTLTDDAVEISALLYGRAIPLEAIDAQSIDTFDLDRGADRAPRWRTNGIGLPGYRLGWFKLRSGAKALMIHARGHKTVYFDTTLGYSVLLTPVDADRFSADLADRIAAHRR